MPCDFFCGALCKVPIQIHIYIIEVPLIKGKWRCPLKTKSEIPVNYVVVNSRDCHNWLISKTNLNIFEVVAAARLIK